MKQATCPEEFRRAAIRIVTTRDQSISSVVSGLGIGKSTLKRWRQMIAEYNLLFGPHKNMSLELARLRKENELLRQERDLFHRPLELNTPFFVRETRR